MDLSGSDLVAEYWNLLIKEGTRSADPHDASRGLNLELQVKTEKNIIPLLYAHAITKKPIILSAAAALPLNLRVKVKKSDDTCTRLRVRMRV